VRKLSLIILAGALLNGCGMTQPEPVTYGEKVSVHSVLPVHVTMHEAHELPAPGNEDNFAFGFEYQDLFVESLKSELVTHGIFGSIADSGGDDIFEVDVNFARVARFTNSSHYKLTVALATEYQGERDFNQYHVLFMNEDFEPDSAENETDFGQRQVATELMSLIMSDIQQAVVERKVSLKAHVKEQHVNIPRTLVKL
jgi:hypothetical protein